MWSRLPTRLVPALLLAALVLPTKASAGSRHQTVHRQVVVLDPGHGGSDTGAVDNGLEEKVLTLQVAKAASAYLAAMGYRVYLTRTRDQSPNTPPRDLNGDGTVDHVDDLDARNLLANRVHADVIVSIHFDASTSPATTGTHGYYCPNRPFQARSHRLATILTASIARALTAAGWATPNNGVGTDVADPIPQSRADYPWFLVLGPSLRHFVTGTAMPGALIETLYLTSTRDSAALKHRGAIGAIARGYAAGIRSFLSTGTRR